MDVRGPRQELGRGQVQTFVLGLNAKKSFTGWAE